MKCSFRDEPPQPPQDLSATPAPAQPAQETAQRALDSHPERVPLYFGRTDKIVGYSIVDVADLPLVSGYRWHLHSRGYACRGFTVGGRREGHKTTFILMHRVILGLEGSDIHADHINGDRLDNRRENLRVASVQQNAENSSRHRDGSSRFRGVSWDASKQRWVAQLSVQGRHHYLGCFKDEETAGRIAAAYRGRLMPFSPEARG